MAGNPTRTLFPVIPLASDSVLLPGTSLRVPVGGRNDIPALLSAVYSKTEKAYVVSPNSLGTFAAKG